MQNIRHLKNLIIILHALNCQTEKKVGWTEKEMNIMINKFKS